MTTQVHVVNASDSNPQQNAKVTFTRTGQEPQVVLLAPGTSKSWWIGSSDDIHVTEVSAP